MKSWSEYLEFRKNHPPSPLLESAVCLVVNRRQALDLGAGALQDSKFLLSLGFQKVTAVDQSPQTRKYRDKIPARQLRIQIDSFENLKIKPNFHDLITAQYSLPFTVPPHLPKLMKQIKDGLRPAGIFCAQFFGPRDSWNIPQSKLTFISKARLQKLLSPLNIIYFQELQYDQPTADGTAKHWHVLEVIALKPLPKHFNP